MCGAGGPRHRMLDFVPRHRGRAGISREAIVAAIRVPFRGHGSDPSRPTPTRPRRSRRKSRSASVNRVTVIPVRMMDATPSDAFLYELATRQWIDVFGDWADSIRRRLADHVKKSRSRPSPRRGSRRRARGSGCRFRPNAAVAPGTGGRGRGADLPGARRRRIVVVSGAAAAGADTIGAAPGGGFDDGPGSGALCRSVCRDVEQPEPANGRHHQTRNHQSAGQPVDPSVGPMPSDRLRQWHPPGSISPPAATACPIARTSKFKLDQGSVAASGKDVLDLVVHTHFTRRVAPAGLSGDLPVPERLNCTYNITLYDVQKLPARQLPAKSGSPRVRKRSRRAGFMHRWGQHGGQSLAPVATVNSGYGFDSGEKSLNML